MFLLEHLASDRVVWWITSPDLPRLFASATNRNGCRARAHTAFFDRGHDTTDILDHLVVSRRAASSSGGCVIGDGVRARFDAVGWCRPGLSEARGACVSAVGDMSMVFV